ncbi:dihydroorotase [Namhaeicola litoreus]|uniref:Dihydroorotase family protein n=1 Tax=Namhaeicola litoreus TaxID=1052145 RepID=A0ABW3Y7C9_9FLAO
MNVLLKSAKIIDKNSQFNGQTKDVLIERGIIIQIADNIEKKGNIREISYKNLHVSNGWFDSSVSFAEPGYEERETIDNGIDVAAKSGFTAVALNPNTNPKIDHKSAVEFLVNKGNLGIVDLYPIGNLTINAEGKELAELYDMFRTGAIAFGDYNKSLSNANLLKVALLYAQNFDGLVISFPQDNQLAQHGFVNEGVNSTKLGLKSIPSLAEELQIARDLFLLEYTGGKLHIPTISTANSVKLIREAKKKGLNISCSVTPHHLNLNDEFLHDFDPDFKVTPPLRTKTDSKALIKGVIDGTIDMITSDHNPIDIENKKVEMENALYGTIGLESAFGSLCKILPLETLISALTEKPRSVFGVSSSKIAEGNSANLTLFNPESEYIFTSSNIRSSSKNSIFKNQKMKGSVYGIINKNNIVLAQ